MKLASCRCTARHAHAGRAAERARSISSAPITSLSEPAAACAIVPCTCLAGCGPIPHPARRLTHERPLPPPRRRMAPPPQLRSVGPRDIARSLGKRSFSLRAVLAELIGMTFFVYA